MLQKLSSLIPSDSTGVFLVRLFQVYRDKVAKVGNFIKTSIRDTRPKNFLRKKRKVKSFVIRSKFKLFFFDTTSLWYNTNNCVILKKRLHTRGRVVLGPTTFLIKRKKFLRSFIKVL